MLEDSVPSAAVSPRCGNNFHYIIYTRLYRNENAAFPSLILRRKKDV